MTDFPDSVDLVVSDLYNNYVLGLSDEEDDVHVWCERCDDIVCTFEHEGTENDDEMDLYEMIVDKHRPIE